MEGEQNQHVQRSDEGHFRIFMDASTFKAEIEGRRTRTPDIYFRIFMDAATLHE